MSRRPDKKLVFSYGTLKRGFPNYRLIKEAKASYMGEAITNQKYPLLQAGRWNAPFLIDRKDYPGSHRIKGELFEVDENGMNVLDEFEGVGSGYYKREKIKVSYKTKSNEELTTEAWCYFCDQETSTLLKNAATFISHFGEEELQKYIPVHDRPSDWKKEITMK